MSSVLYPGSRVDVDALPAHPDRIDVRSPAEFADDHIPGAHNHPVLDDDERARIGIMHAASPFEARRLGAALVARNIAKMLRRHSPSSRANGSRWSIAGAAASAVARSRMC